eukprot:TRINITY_DN3777_c0_g1_i3.p1 TRINITY_DN3777_c0_g1~~TRINITY_DN3777_c0_g1_i3.p1  ORF type:complete len:961 (-),score=239.52 TRINITY_DN3777_c0_g1_i3:111-2993(-)
MSEAGEALPAWQTSIAQLLKQRDATEQHPFRAVFKAYTHTVQSHRQLADDVVTLQRVVKSKENIYVDGVAPKAPGTPGYVPSPSALPTTPPPPIQGVNIHLSQQMARMEEAIKFVRSELVKAQKQNTIQARTISDLSQQIKEANEMLLERTRNAGVAEERVVFLESWLRYYQDRLTADKDMMSKQNIEIMDLQDKEGLLLKERQILSLRVLDLETKLRDTEARYHAENKRDQDLIQDLFDQVFKLKKHITVIGHPNMGYNNNTNIVSLNASSSGIVIGSARNSAQFEKSVFSTPITALHSSPSSSTPGGPGTDSDSTSLASSSSSISSNNAPPQSPIHTPSPSINGNLNHIDTHTTTPPIGIPFHHPPGNFSPKAVPELVPASAPIPLLPLLAPSLESHSLPPNSNSNNNNNNGIPEYGGYDAGSSPLSSSLVNSISLAGMIGHDETSPRRNRPRSLPPVPAKKLPATPVAKSSDLEERGNSRRTSSTPIPPSSPRPIDPGAGSPTGGGMISFSRSPTSASPANSSNLTELLKSAQTHPSGSHSLVHAAEPSTSLPLVRSFSAGEGIAEERSPMMSASMTLSNSFLPASLLPFSFISNLASSYSTSSSSLAAPSAAPSAPAVKKFNETCRVPTALIRTIEAHSDQINCVAHHYSGSLLATGSTDHLVKLWEAFPETYLSTPVLAGTGVDQAPSPLVAPLPHSAPPRVVNGPHSSVLSVAFSITNQLMCAGTNENSIYVWSTEGKCAQQDTLVAHTAKVVGVAFLDGRTLASGSHDRTIKTFDLTTGYSTGSISCGTKVNDLCLGGQARTVCSAHFDKSVRQYDLTNGAVTSRMHVHSNEVTSVTLSPDSRCVLTSSKDNTLKLTDLRNLSVVQTFTHANYRSVPFPSSACFSWDGKLVVAGGTDGQVFLWNAVSGKTEGTLQCERRLPVSGVSWHPSRNQLLVACGRTLSIWEAPPVTRQ